MIKRSLENTILQKLDTGKVIIVLGARQTGKTTLVNEIIKQKELKTLYWNGDEPDTRQELLAPTSTLLREKIGNHQLIVIDEAQRIENIGLILKLMVDQIPNINIIATGSSSFELANKINEPLTGRKWEYTLYPISTEELVANEGEQIEKRKLEHRLVYGYYPEIVNHLGDEKELLLQLADSYLYKDILIWEQIKKPQELERMLQAIAFQVGNLVSLQELARLSGLSFHTVERYINVLEKAFVIFSLSSFSRNLRNEIKKSKKIYFYDNGIRNAVIKQFSSIRLRNDMGALWENYLMSERMKYLSYHRIFANRFFWRTAAGQEIDYVEERDGEIIAYEFKWNPKKKSKFPNSFVKQYNPAETKIINQDNYLSFVM